MSRSSEPALGWLWFPVCTVGHDHDQEPLRESLDDAPRLAPGRRTGLDFPGGEHLAERGVRLVIKDHAADIGAQLCIEPPIDLEHAA